MPELVLNTRAILIRECFKTNIIRRLLTLFFIVRAWQIVVSYYWYQGGLLNEEWVFTIIYMAVLSMMLISSKWYFPLLAALIQYKFDDYYFCHTVGSNLFCFMALYFSLFEYGKSKYFSADAEEVWLKYINHRKYLLVAVWSILHLISVFNHLNEPVWREGRAAGLILTNAFISPFFEFFRNAGITDSVLSKILTYLFLILQCLMLPLFIFKRTRFLFYLHLLVFCVVVTFLADTAYLAHASWLLLFLLLPVFTLRHGKIYIVPSSIQWDKTPRLLNRTVVALLGAFIIIHTPGVNVIAKKGIWLFREWDTYRYAERKLTMLGLTQLNVFNAYQIEKGDRWFCIYREQSDKKWELRPYVDRQGRKLHPGIDWLHSTNHGSDFILYANTFQYACGIEQVDYTNATTPDKLKGKVYERLVRYDFNRYSASDEQQYKVEFMHIANNTVLTDSFVYYKVSAQALKRTAP